MQQENNLAHHNHFRKFEAYHIVRFAINVIRNIDNHDTAVVINMNMWICVVIEFFEFLKDNVTMEYRGELENSLSILKAYNSKASATQITKDLLSRDDYSVLLARDALVKIVESTIYSHKLEKRYGDIARIIKRLPTRFSDYVKKYGDSDMSNATFIFLKSLPEEIYKNPLSVDMLMFAMFDAFSKEFRLAYTFFDAVIKGCLCYSLIYPDNTDYNAVLDAARVIANNPGLFVVQTHAPDLEITPPRFAVAMGAVRALGEMLFDTEQDFWDTYCSVTDLTHVPEFDSFVGVQNADFIKRHLKSAIKNKAKGVNYLFYGDPGVGKTSFALSLCKELGVKAHIIDFMYYIQREQTAILSSVQFLWTTARTVERSSKDPIVCIIPCSSDFFRTGLNGLQTASKSEIFYALGTNKCPFIFVIDDISQVEPDLVRGFSIVKEFKAPTRQQTAEIAEYYETKHHVRLSSATKQLLVENRVPAAVVESLCEAMGTAKMNRAEQINFVRDYSAAMALDFNERPVRPTGKYDYSLLNTDQDLHKIAQAVLASGNKNFQMLLHGVSGTGKSEFAKVLADTLGMKVIKKKASDLMSKWSGETEQKIRDMFDEQRENDALLLIDEAEYFLHDRRKSSAQWENSVVGEMLANMEDCELPIIMTTNVMGAIDPAFMRRFTFTVKFDYMKSEQVKTAFKHFLKINIDDTTGLNRLAPGDFAMFNKRNVFLGLKDKDAIVAEFKKIQEQKNEKKTEKIGF